MGRPHGNVLDEYNAIHERRKSQPLTPEQEQRLELLRDVLLELGALPPEGSGMPARPARADAVLELSFATQEDVVRAYSKNIGAGGLAIKTSRVLPQGSILELRIKLPDAPQPLLAQGQVAWAREDEMGVAFTQLPPEGERRLKDLLAADASLLKRVRSVLKSDVVTLLKTDVRELGKAPAPQAAQAQEVDTRPLILVRLLDARLMALVAELFSQQGLRITSETDKPVSIIVVDTGTALDVLRAAGRPGVRIVMVNVSGPDSLVGRLTNLNPAAYVKHPANAASVHQVVTKLLETAAPR
ncbi:cyclic nucleotide-binding protein [Pyxidicoccus fallax]|uniref:Cyclic nucleotide-binding protein n=1 Tax=Pyxidicoccus fallax TaxID=394095 RepID=A0A848LKF3_9BACT|nr:PilZ domain-containing protein [Pyxidicoccus fallax]NMO18245.1 cyclic nucleotide-binding protein [Pyxidicoccus fallax]NPC79991.1 cyclic nucleotide-binding protein [Pyxidicoccus fallax]